MDLKKIIVIGASAGGLKAVKEVLRTVTPDLLLAIFVVIHLSKKSSSDIISRLLQKETSYRCIVPHDNEEIQAGNLYLAPQDLHMAISGKRIRLVRGPHENRWRPSIDVLFRSAAVHYNSSVIGVVLTGMLDDGTSGMLAIKRCGGICIVQEPDEAEFSDMPVNVLSNVKVDYRVPIADMGYIISDLLSKPTPPSAEVPEDIRIEANITERMASNLEDMQKIGEHSNYVCPDCGGGLWKIKNEPIIRFRCHTGHVYSEDSLLEKQAEVMEESLWVSIRMMEERRNILKNVAWRQREMGQEDISAIYESRAQELSAHIERLKSLLINVGGREHSDEDYL